MIKANNVNCYMIKLYCKDFNNICTGKRNSLVIESHKALKPYNKIIISESTIWNKPTHRMIVFLVKNSEIVESNNANNLKIQVTGIVISSNFIRS